MFATLSLSVYQGYFCFVVRFNEFVYIAKLIMPHPVSSNPVIRYDLLLTKPRPCRVLCYLALWMRVRLFFHTIWKLCCQKMNHKLLYVPYLKSYHTHAKKNGDLINQCSGHAKTNFYVLSIWQLDGSKSYFWIQAVSFIGKGT